MTDVIVPQNLGPNQFATAISSTGTLVGSTVDYSQLTFNGILFALTTSESTNTVSYGNKSFTLDDMAGFAVDYTVQIISGDDLTQYMYGVITALDTDFQVATVAITVINGSITDCSSWTVQVVAGPSFGVAASATNGVSGDTIAIPVVTNPQTINTDAAKLFTPGSHIVCSALSDSSQYFRGLSYIYNSTGVLRLLITDVGANSTGNYSAWGVNAQDGPATSQTFFASVVAGTNQFSVAPGQVVNTGNTALFRTTLPTTFSFDALFSTNGMLSLTGNITSSTGTTAVTGSGTNFSTDTVVGGQLFTANGLVGLVNSITSTTKLNLTTVAFANNTSTSYANLSSGFTYTLFAILKDSDLTTHFAIQQGASTTVASVPAGYTYYTSIGTFTFDNTLGLTNLSPVPPYEPIVTSQPGDMIYRSGAGRDIRLTIGSTGSILSVAAGVPSWIGQVPVSNGGTGASTLTAGQFLLGNGTSAVNVTGLVSVSLGGTGTTTLTANGVLLGNGTSSVTIATIGTSGQALISNGTTSAPTFQTLASNTWSSVATGNFAPNATSSALVSGGSDMLIVIAGLSYATAARTALVRVSTDGSTFDSTISHYMGWNVNGASATGTATLIDPTPQTASEVFSSSIFIQGYNVNSYKQYQSGGAGGSTTTGIFNVMGFYNQTATIQAIQISCSGTGTADAGSYTIYVR